MKTVNSIKAVNTIKDNKTVKTIKKVKSNKYIFMIEFCRAHPDKLFGIKVFKIGL